jgi:hypothetical protein
MKDKFDSTEKVSQDDWDALYKFASFNFKKLSPYLQRLLFDCQDAKNYLSFQFVNEQKENFWVILRKDKSDPNVICPTCGTFHVVDARVLNPLGGLATDAPPKTNPRAHHQFTATITGIHSSGNSKPLHEIFINNIKSSTVDVTVKSWSILVSGKFTLGKPVAELVVGDTITFEAQYDVRQDRLRYPRTIEFATQKSSWQTDREFI